MKPLISMYTFGPVFDNVAKDLSWTIIERALCDAHVPLSTIDDRRCHIPYAAQAKICETLARAAGEAHYVAAANVGATFSSLGVFGKYVAQSSTLLEACVRARRGVHTVSNSTSLGLIIVGDEVTFTFDSGIKRVLGSRHVHEGVIWLLVDLVRNYLGAEWNPKRIEFDFPKPPRPSVLEDLFEAPIIFDQAATGLVIDASRLSEPNINTYSLAERVTFGDLRRMYRDRPGRTNSDVVLEVLRLSLRDSTASIEDAACRLGTSVRSLQRQLHQEGTHFRDLVNRARKRRALELLAETNAQVGCIAAELGYSSPGHFIRAFRLWTGEPPSAVRRRLRANVSSPLSLGH